MAKFHLPWKGIVRTAVAGKIGSGQISGRGPTAIAINTKISVDSRDFATVQKNLEVVGDLVTNKSIRAVALIAVDLLANSLPTVPVASNKYGKMLPRGGDLRRSGRATVLYRGGKELADVAHGTKYGQAKVDLSRLRTIKGAYKKAQRVGSRVTYQRVNSAGLDIALWAHEELLPWISRPKGMKPAELKGFYVARRQGTGPKYLEAPFLQRKGEYVAYLKSVLSNQAIQNDLMGLGKKAVRPGTGKFQVRKVELTYSVVDKAVQRVGKP